MIKLQILLCLWCPVEVPLLSPTLTCPKKESPLQIRQKLKLRPATNHVVNCPVRTCPHLLQQSWDWPDCSVFVWPWFVYLPRTFLPSWRWLLGLDLRHSRRSHILCTRRVRSNFYSPTWIVFRLLGRYHNHLFLCSLRLDIFSILYPTDLLWVIYEFSTVSLLDV